MEDAVYLSAAAAAARLPPALALCDAARRRGGRGGGRPGAGAEGGGAVRLAAGGLGRRQRQVRPPGERARLPRRRPQLVLLLPGREKPKFRRFSRV